MSVEVKVSKPTVTGRSKFNAKERKLRQEASRLSSLANKRLKRMEQQNLQKSPAYQSWVDSGGAKFGVRGKTMAQVQAEVGRLNKFINQSTSTVTGAKNYFKKVGRNVGITEFKDIPDLQRKLNNFFEITGKVKEYLHNTKEIGVAIDYKKVWEIVSDYVEEVGDDVVDVEKAVLEIAENILPASAMGFADDTLDDFLDGF